MSQNTSILARPTGDEKVSKRAIGYASESAREELFDLVLRNCVESGVTKATLARRLDKDPAQITRLLGAPGNWTIDTVAELLFAIDGSLLSASSFQPLDEPVGNMRHATCFARSQTDIDVIYVSEVPKKAKHSSRAALSWK
ncbi:hypothetical protein BKP54_25375 [Ensifer sp. 1H6]|nr:hypothetical protein BKP54_25375 [Ensifer sp. 1H6]